MPQARLLAELSAAFSFAGGLIADAHTTDASGQFLKPRDARSFVTEAAVLKIFIAWEKFLEQSFLEYLMGSPTTTGSFLTCYLKPVSLDHANLVLIGTQRYVDWGNPDIVIRLAKLYFDGGAPYQVAISAILTDLIDFRSIRNAAAHLSTSTSKQLDQLALRKLGRAVVGVSVYELVTAADPRVPSKTVLQSYIDSLEAAAISISHG